MSSGMLVILSWNISAICLLISGFTVPPLSVPNAAACSIGAPASVFCVRSVSFGGVAEVIVSVTAVFVL